MLNVRTASRTAAMAILMTAVAMPVHATLVMHLGFEGDFTDSSGFGNNAQVDSRSVGTATTVAGGISGSALSLSGGLAWLEVANSASISPTTGITMSAWVNPTGRIGNNSGIFFKGPLAGAQPDWQLTINDVGTGGTLGPSGASASINGTGFATSQAAVIDYSFLQPVPNGAWTHLASTYDGTTMSLYVNGTLVDTDLVSTAIDTSGSDLYIGNRFRPSGDVGGFQGLMDELRIYDSALSAAEIRALAMVSSVPAPATVGLLGLAIAVLGLRGRMSRRS